MSCLFVHFREKRTEDGEQIYFALSKDGYNWQEVNDGVIRQLRKTDKLHLYFCY